MRKTALNTAFWTSLVISLGFSLSACGGGHQEVKAPERVEAAAEIARANAPEAEDMEFAETEPMVLATTETAEVATADTGVAAAEATASEDLAVNVGADLYNKQCMACHATGLLNAPKLGDTAAWSPRIEKGLDTLTTHSAEGFNQMPPQAYNGVTEDQIRQAVEYMIAESS